MVWMIDFSIVKNELLKIKISLQWNYGRHHAKIVFRKRHCFFTWITIYMVFTTKVFFPATIESWPEWDLNPPPLNSVLMLWLIELSRHEFNPHSEQTLYCYFNFIVCSVPGFILAIAFVSHYVCFNWIGDD